jgi:hypothetical protein
LFAGFPPPPISAPLPLPPLCPPLFNPSFFAPQPLLPLISFAIHRNPEPEAAILRHQLLPARVRGGFLA